MARYYVKTKFVFSGVFGVSLTFCTKVSLSIIFQKEAIIFICLNSQKRWFKRSL